MTKVTVTKKGPLAFKIHINGTNLKFKNNKATRSLPDGEHALQWFVRGAPGAQYTVAIAQPKKAQLSHTGKLDVAQKDAGLAWFTL